MTVVFLRTLDADTGLDTETVFDTDTGADNGTVHIPDNICDMECEAHQSLFALLERCLTMPRIFE